MQIFHIKNVLGKIAMALFNSGNNEQKQKKKQAEKILDKTVGGLMPSATRMAFFKRMNDAGIKARHQERVRSKVLKTIKKEVENNQLEPTTEAINARIEQILVENSDHDLIEKRRQNYVNAVQKQHFQQPGASKYRYCICDNQ